jgi:hypothetical protein
MLAPTAVSLQDKPSTAVGMVVVDPAEGDDPEEVENNDDGDDKIVEDAIEDTELEVDVARAAYPTTIVPVFKAKGAPPSTQPMTDPLMIQPLQQNSEKEPLKVE